MAKKKAKRGRPAGVDKKKKVKKAKDLLKTARKSKAPVAKKKLKVKTKKPKSVLPSAVPDACIILASDNTMFTPDNGFQPLTYRPIYFVKPEAAKKILKTIKEDAKLGLAENIKAKAVPASKVFANAYSINSTTYKPTAEVVLKSDKPAPFKKLVSHIKQSILSRSVQINQDKKVNEASHALSMKKYDKGLKEISKQLAAFEKSVAKYG